MQPSLPEATSNSSDSERDAAATAATLSRAAKQLGAGILFGVRARGLRLCSGR